MSFTSRGSARFNWLCCTLANLKVTAMIAYDVATKVLHTEVFYQHNITGLISGILFVLFSQKPLGWKQITNTQIQHTTLFNFIISSKGSLEDAPLSISCKFCIFRTFDTLFFNFFFWRGKTKSLTNQFINSRNKILTRPISNY